MAAATKWQFNKREILLAKHEFRVNKRLQFSALDKFYRGPKKAFTWSSQAREEGQGKRIVCVAHLGPGTNYYI